MHIASHRAQPGQSPYPSRRDVAMAIDIKPCFSPLNPNIFPPHHS